MCISDNRITAGPCGARPPQTWPQLGNAIVNFQSHACCLDKMSHARGRGRVQSGQLQPEIQRFERAAVGALGAYQIRGTCRKGRTLFDTGVHPVLTGINALESPAPTYVHGSTVLPPRWASAHPRTLQRDCSQQQFGAHTIRPLLRRGESTRPASRVPTTHGDPDTDTAAILYLFP